MHAVMYLPGKNIRHRHETIDRNFLGSRSRVNARLLQQGFRIDSQSLEALSQHFPPLPEGCLGYPLQCVSTASRRDRLRRQPYH